MFGKLKNIFNKAEEAIENLQENNTTQSSNSENESVQSSYQPEPIYFEDYIDYSNIIPEIDEHYVDNYENFYNALNSNNRQKVEKAITIWKNDLEKYKEQVRKMGPYEGDDTLQQHAIAYFDDKIKNIENDFEPYAEAFLTDATNQQELYDRAENNKMALYDRINDQLEKFVQKYEDKNSDIGIEQMYQQHDAKVLEDSKDNPLLEPIHGVSLYDYAAGVVKIGSNVPEADVLKALGVDKPQWDEASLIWNQRMEQDTEMTVMTLYSQYFTKIDEHPTLGNNGNLSADTASNPNLERLKTDEHFFYDLAAERDAAIEVGKDGAQYILDKYGIGIVDFQAQAVIWTRSGNYSTMITYQMEKKEEYLKQFQNEMGGTIADDIEF
ncbi:hypothetical protein HXZ94_11075 [Empedobacter falsenii]|uniref:DUF6620 family protein n=1 Tax=Empedobacter falsenii TaxID=343874 RepID=UPI002578367E|nr:DUF6620 family protein [Empedobacter falsenii]MDM1299035.1 hypothetical protein [Empedobacter falsenii]MDM1318828.1 hypothetical protein [Empedobacter falsenii]